MLQHHFSTALKPYATEAIINSLWQELEKAYTPRGPRLGRGTRYYHTLTHLEALLQDLLPLQEKFKQWSTVVMPVPQGGSHCVP